MARVFDNNGRELSAAEVRALFVTRGSSGHGHLGDATADATVDQSASAAPSSSFGAALFEFFHPEQVQAEYAAVGKAAPPVTDIMGQALTDMGDFAASGVTGVVSGAESAAANLETIVKLALVAGIMAGGYVIYRKLTK